MKKVFKVIGYLLLGLVFVIGAFALFVQIDGIPSYTPEKIELKVVSTPEKVAEGKKWACPCRLP